MTQEWNPGLLLKLSGSYWQTCALHAGVKLDIFTVIGDQYLTGKQIAEKADIDERAIIMLLNALTAMNLLNKEGETYQNTTASKAFLSKDSNRFIGYMIKHHHHLMDSWAHLDQSIKTGKPIRERSSFSEEERRESFLMGMFANAMYIAPEVASAINLTGRKHLVDIGGGPGTYAIHFCLKNPELKATVYDLATTKPFAEKIVEKFGMEDRIDFSAGNYIKEGIKGTYDVAWLSHILHGEGPEDCLIIIRKAVSSLEPGGTVLIHDFILDNTMDGPLFPALFSLNMLLGTPKGQSYNEAQLIEMMYKAGVKEIQRIPFRGPTDSGILMGTVL